MEPQFYGLEVDQDSPFFQTQILLYFWALGNYPEQSSTIDFFLFSAIPTNNKMHYTNSVRAYHIFTRLKL